MNDADCVRILQWALPRLGLHWAGFRRVRRQVCKRLGRRLQALGLTDVTDYRVRLESEAEEWERLDGLCRISISRFSRDQGVFRCLERQLLPRLAMQALAEGKTRLRIWSAGCASGEEPYTLALMWAFAAPVPGREPEIVATDVEPHLLARARRACYPPSSLRELPGAWRSAFERQDKEFCLKPAYRATVRFLEQDVRERSPEGRFDLILCRNLVFTYFERPFQIAVARRMTEALSCPVACFCSARTSHCPERRRGSKQSSPGSTAGKCHESNKPGSPAWPPSGIGR